MSADRDTALAFMTALWAADLATTDTMMSESAIWLFQLGMPQASVPGRGREWPAREALRRIITDLFGKFDSDGFSVTTTRIIGDTGAIAIEYAARGRTARGAIYQNYYVTTLTIENGKVTEIRPYNDTAQMLAALEN